MASASPSATDRGRAAAPDGAAGEAAAAAAAAWAHAVRLYAAPGMRAACLRLQDEGGVDVLLLLEACRHGAAGREVGAEAASRMRAAAAAWREGVVGPLRRARRHVREIAAASAARGWGAAADGTPAEALRRLILDAELEAERLALAALATVGGSGGDAGEPPGEPGSAIVANLEALGVRPPSAIGPELAAVVAAALALGSGPPVA